MTCPKCGLPDELCMCDEMSRESQRIKITSDRRTYGKIVTIVEGLGEVDTQKIAKKLKKKLACGGTAKEERIELQGDHINRVKDILTDMGFSEDMIEVA